MEKVNVVERGAITERGSHDDLLAAGGVYAQLVRRQLAAPSQHAEAAPPTPGGDQPPPLLAV